MDVLKDDTTERLDSLTELADDTLDFYRDLKDQLEDRALRSCLAAVISEQSQLLQSLMETREAHRDLPQAGDNERGHLLAMLAMVRSALSPDDGPLIHRIREANRAVADAAAKALESGLHDDERKLVAAIANRCMSFDATLDKAD
jgi:hypothetical protein